MFAAIAAFLLLQAAQPEPPPAPAGAPAAEAEESDVYTDCFFRELAVLEGRKVEDSPDGFSKKKAIKALTRCQRARAQLAAKIDGELAADPQYADKRLRAVALENAMGVTELALLLLIRMRGR